MGIEVEFNPDLNLRAFGTNQRDAWECLPQKLERNITYGFKKQGQRNYWLEGEIPLQETTGEGNLSRPLAAVRITEVTHKKQNGQIWTMGQYEIIELCKKDRIYFEGMKYIPGGIEIK